MKNFLRSLVVSELAFCARLIYTRFRPFVIGVTGSSGKTTTKYMIEKLLDGSVNSLEASSENLNSEFGLPLVLLGYKSAPKSVISWLWVVISSPFKAFFKTNFSEYLVLEYAADKPGDIEHLVSLVPPDIAVITNIGVAHLAAFKSVEKIAEEKWKIASQANKVIVNGAVEEKVKPLAPAKADIVVVGSRGTVNVSSVKEYKNKTEFNIDIAGSHFDSVEIPFIGKHNIDDLMLAVMAAFSVTGNAKAIVKNISKIKLIEGRGKRFVRQDGSVVIDESYNANPASMVAALHNISKIGFGRKVVILGEMKELGKISERSHHEVAKVAKKVADFTVGVGEGFKGEEFDKWYVNAHQLSLDLDLIIKNDDTILVKGSHSVGLEKIVEKLEEGKI